MSDGLPMDRSDWIRYYLKIIYGYAYPEQRTEELNRTFIRLREQLGVPATLPERVSRIESYLGMKP
jgi:hypothetical protein